jgi:hypothetical protein
MAAPDGAFALGQIVLDADIALEAPPTLVNPSWRPLETNTLINGSISFGDPTWMNYTSLFHRLLWP